MNRCANLTSPFLLLLAVCLFVCECPAQTALPFNLPLYFQADKSQTEFLSSGSGYQFLISPSGAQINLSASSTNMAMAQMSFTGASPFAKICGQEKLGGKINYLIGNNPSQWQTGLPTFAKVQIANIYPGIDLVYHGNQQQLEYDFDIAPGISPNVIRIRFDGMDKISITPQGDLILNIGGSEIRQPKPEIYQSIAGKNTIVSGGYKMLDAQTVAFETGHYDPSLPLVIDPILTYSAFFAGNFSGTKSASAWSIALDTNNYIYIAGQTLSKEFFTTGAFQTNFAGGKRSGDAFIAKFGNPATNLIYLTYLGGSYEDAAFGIAVNKAGNAFVTGYTESPDFPTNNAIFPKFPGSFNSLFGIYPASAFVTELSADGGSLVYSTFLGGTNENVATSIALDSSDDAYVAGYTYSKDFPISQSAVQKTLACSNNIYLNANAFITEISPNDSSPTLLYSTFLGGTNFDAAQSIFVDNNNFVYVAGYTASTNFPIWNVPAGVSTMLNGVPLKKGNNDNSLDAFVTKFPPLATQPSSISNLIYSTYLGGTNSETAYGVAADSLGCAYVTGFTASTNFPTTNNNPAGLFSFMVTNGTSSRTATNVFLTKLDTNGTLLDSVVFGGRGVDIGYGVAVDAAGDAFVVGGATSTNFPTMNTAGPLSATNSYKQGYDVFVAGFSNDWSRMYYSVFMGGRKDDIGYGIALDASTNVFITGKTMSTNFPTQNANLFSFNGSPIINGTNSIDGTMFVKTNDAFVAEIALGALPTGPVITNALPPAQTNSLFTDITLTIGASGTPPLIYQWQMTNSAMGVLTNLNARDKKRFTGTTSNSLTILDAQLTNTGTYFVIVTNNWGAVTDSIDLTILPFAPQITVPLTNQTVSEGDTVVFPITATGTPPVHYQWQFNGTDIIEKSPFSGTKTNTLVLTNAQTTNAGTYSIIVTNDFGAVTDSMTLTVLTFPPVITNAPPQFQTNGMNTTFALTINASGSPPLFYQWQFNGTNLTSKDTGYAGVNSNSLTFKDAKTNQSGDYTVIVTNRYGTASTNLNVTIVPFAPEITVPPTNTTANVGDLAFFEVGVSGTTPLHIQWQLNGTNLANKSPYIGVTNSTLIMTNVQLSEAGTYTIVVTNAFGSVSTNATLTVVPVPPTITNAPPQFQTNGVGTTFNLSILVSGSPPFFYQWQHAGTNLTSKSKGYLGFNTSSLIITNAQTNQSGEYVVIVTNKFGSATTNMNVLIIPMAPIITVPPTNQTVGIGNTVTFPITATGTRPLHYQWQRDGTNLLNKGNFSGVNTNTLKIASVQTNDSGTISIIVTNNYGAVTDSVTLAVLPLPPEITVAPTNEISGLGGIVTFNVTATGSLPLFYQWRTNGVNLPKGPHYGGINTNSFTITNTQPADAGTYEVVITNAFGLASTNATLTVLTAPVMTISLTGSNITDGLTFSIVGGTNGGSFNLYGTTNLQYTPISTTWSNLASATFSSQGSFSAALPTSLFDPTNDQEFFILQQH